MTERRDLPEPLNPGCPSVRKSCAFRSLQENSGFELYSFIRGIPTFQRNLRPAIDPSDGGDLQIGVARGAVIGVENNDVAVFLLQQRLSSGPDPSAVSQQ